MVTMCRLLIALFTLYVSFLDFGAAYPIQNYPVNWSLVPVTPSPERNLNSLYLGECVCDITRGYCDPFCCCDIDCSKEAVALFEYCSPEQYGYPYVDYCYKENSATQLKKINLFIEEKTQAYDAICIVRANHPSELYRFFQVPTNVKKPTAQPIFHRVLQNGTYRAGSPLMALKYIDSGNDTRYQCNGYLQLPVQSDTGSCEFRYGQNVQFLHPINGVSCSMSGAELCEFSPISVFANLLVAPPGNSSQLIDTAFPVVLRILNESGEEVAVIDPLDVNWDKTLDSRVVNGICLNSVTAVELIFTYNATSSNFTLVDSVVNVRTAKNISLTAFAQISFRSLFRVNNNSADTDEFIPATVGFTIGGIVRAGSMVHQGEKRAIAERKYGFAVPSGGGSCALSNLRNVRFMHSVAASGCSIGVTEATLQEMCEQGTEQQIMGVLNTTTNDQYGLIDYVAVTGDALSNDTTSWIPIDGLQNLDFSPGQFNPVTRECRNITVGVRYTFVIARAGAEYNPQDIIVGAFAESIVGTWKMRGKDIFTTTTEGTQYLRFQAIFSRYNPDSQATVRRRVKAPPILPSLDDTIFYPFS